MKVEAQTLGAWCTPYPGLDGILPPPLQDKDKWDLSGQGYARSPKSTQFCRVQVPSSWGQTRL